MSKVISVRLDSDMLEMLEDIRRKKISRYAGGADEEEMKEYFSSDSVLIRSIIFSAHADFGKEKVNQ